MENLAMTEHKEMLKKQICSKRRIITCMCANRFSEGAIEKKEKELEELEKELEELK